MGNDIFACGKDDIQSCGLDDIGTLCRRNPLLRSGRWGSKKREPASTFREMPVLKSVFLIETRLVLGNLLGHLNRSGVLAVLGDFLLTLDVGGAAATLGLLTMLLTHSGSVFGL